MGRKQKQKAKIIEHEEDERNDVASSFAFSNDDEDANQDLSLKIVEKALWMRAARLAANDDVLGGGGGDGDVGSLASLARQPELAVERHDAVLNGPSGIAASEVMERKINKVKKVESGDRSIIIAEKQETAETIKATEKNESTEASTVQMNDNIVLRKLLRGPRYFDPPDSGWGTCYNCGEEGHTTVNCTAAKRKKPCFVCGSLGHSAKQCTKAQDCFICKKGGHRAKDCPEKYKGSSKSLTVCLKCGNSGHDMFSCKNDYLLDDIKEIQCYVCKRFGHLCCVNPDDATPREISCYKCGELGHTGLACSRLRGETTGAATPSSCYKCGEQGHFARECTSSTKAGKRNRESSNTRTPRFHKENDYKGYRSAPHDPGKARKKKRPLTEERGFTTPKKSKGRGGWMTEHPGDFSPSKSKRNSWRSPGTPPSTKSTKFHSFSSGSHTPSSRSSKMRKVNAGTSKSQGSSMASHHRFSASRFGHSGSDGRRSYDWW